MKHVLALAAAVAIALVGAASASADDSFTVGDAAILGPVHVRGDVAQVHARYSCDVGNHIWVSAKQSGTGEIDPAISAEGSGFGGEAAAWWQSHRGSFTCDGKRHVAWFDVDTVEPGSRGELQKGWAWVQFCVTTDEGLSAVRMAWTRVVVNS
ncbi:MAG TPA: hypothetical protein VK279_10010 [Solirubrobacteraceae bacterium]|nr:hypothetical protein [Solirubrobacteraceae bacterium]